MHHLQSLCCHSDTHTELLGRMFLIIIIIIIILKDGDILKTNLLTCFDFGYYFCHVVSWFVDWLVFMKFFRSSPEYSVHSVAIKKAIHASTVENSSTALPGPFAAGVRLLFFLTFSFFFDIILTCTRCTHGGKFRLSALLRKAVTVGL